MEEPSLRKSRLALAGGLAAALLVGGGGFLLGRATTDRAPEPIAAPPVAAPLPKPAPAPETSRGVLARSDLIALAASVADAVAAGHDPADDVDDVDGRRFELRLPFGCGGPADENSNAPMRWHHDADENVLKIHVAPMVWTAADWWPHSPPPAVSAIEGFWIARPWTASEQCPARDEGPAAVGAEPVTLPGQTLALGHVISAEEAGEGKRQRKAYEASIRVSREELDTSKGFRLRISGRIDRMPNGGPVRCHQPAGAEQRPICLIGVVMDEVAIENAATGKTLAIWTVARQDSAPT